MVHCQQVLAAKIPSDPKQTEHTLIAWDTEWAVPAILAVPFYALCIDSDQALEGKPQDNLLI